jgi:two-component system nitrate/nitrite response regulator NarL
MRVVLVGTPAERARLREQLAGALDVVAEFTSLDAARTAHVDVDAIVVAAAHRPDDAFEEPLTPREIEVVELLAEGLANKAIAARLGISDQTVKFHVASICAKLGAVNRTDAVRRAIRRGLVTV